MVSRLLFSLAGAYVLLLPACAVGGVGSGAVPVRDTGLAGESESGRDNPAEGWPARVQVIMPDERVPCPFEALGMVTVRGPFVPSTDEDDASSGELLAGIRAKLGDEAARMGADAALVRRFLYDRRRPSSTGPAEVRAVEAVLLDFVDPACVRPDR